VWFKEIPLWEQQPEDWWEEVPGLMALYPLCRHGLSPREAVQHAARSITEHEQEPIRRADWLFILNLFGTLAYPRLNPKEIIGSEAMQNSRWYREFRAEERREDILRILRARFGLQGTDDIATALQAVKKLELLDHYIGRSATCASVDEFRNDLQLQAANP
jgi:predicted transposase YdaD